MRERPILFKGPMVRAILDGTKTQTRRLVKPQPTSQQGIGSYTLDGVPGEVDWVLLENGEPVDAAVRCPYGRPGDLLWVKETWAAPHRFDGHKPREIPDDARFHFAATEDLGGLLKRPSLFMQRRFARITLEVVSVRVERLQEISEQDAIEEGVPRATAVSAHVKAPHVAAFSSLWESIKGSGSWDANPWVWRIEFRRVKQ